MSSLTSSLAHILMRQAVRSGYKKFKNNTNNLEGVQRQKLQGLLANISSVDSSIDANWDWETFNKCQPVTEYAEWEERILAQRDGKSQMINSPVSRYQPTSGSTSKFKLIPYSQRFLNDLDQAIMPWFGSLYQNYPNLRKGKQYWSLSWLPESRRELMVGDINDDSKLLSWGKRLLSHFTQTVPQGITSTKSVEDSMFATLAYLLAEKDLTLISVWSPTFAINLLGYLNDDSIRKQLIHTLVSKQWPIQKRDSLEHLPPPKSLYAVEILKSWNGGTPDEYKKLWPNLAMISSWDTAMSVYWAKELRAMFPGVAFQGKGLWMTEGVVTIPWEKNTFILSYQSHFYEFECQETGEILPSWKLKEGMEVIPIISTGSGFLRYKTSDSVRVTGFVNTVPTLEFVGRLSGVDLVGEKLSPAIAQGVLTSVHKQFSDCSPVSLFALDTKVLGKDSGIKPRYVALIKGDFSEQDVQNMAAIGEKALNESYHYELARNLGQLDALTVYCQPDAENKYIELCLSNDMIEGDIKFEPLKYCDNKALIAKLLNFGGMK